jgi:hypothetical protein
MMWIYWAQYTTKPTQRLSKVTQFEQILCLVTITQDSPDISILTLLKKCDEVQGSGDNKSKCLF